MSMNKIRGETELNHSIIKTETMSRDRMSTLVLNIEAEKASKSKNSPN